MKVNQDTIQEKWFIIDAKGNRIGHLASKAAELLLGKNNPLVKPHVLPQNKIIIVNAEKVDFTPKKGFTKFYKRYSGYPGGLQAEDLQSLIKRRPTEPVFRAIKGMIPKNKRGRAILNNLYVYEGETHPHEAQKPEQITLKEINL